MVKWTPKSEDDLDQIGDYIDQVESILSHNPLAGILLESNPFFSKLVVRGNSVFYCENPKDKDLYIVYVQGRYTDLRLERLTAKEIG